MRRHVEAAIEILQLDQSEYSLKLDKEILMFEGEQVCIPSRFYFDEPKVEDERKLTHTQRMVLNCIFLRHHDGFVRQKRLEQLIGVTDSFIIPYSVKLLGEYVAEILWILDKQINSSTIESYVKFINENQGFWELTKNRVVSYWNEYYRHQYPNLNNYIGQQIINRLNLVNAQLAASRHQ